MMDPNAPSPSQGLGLSFSPLAQNATNQPQPGSAVQDAIKILSLRLPRVVGAGGVAPQALMGAPGGGSLDLQTLLRNLLQMTGAPPVSTAGPAGMAPMMPQPQPTLSAGPAPGGTLPLPSITPGTGQAARFQGSEPPLMPELPQGPISSAGPAGSRRATGPGMGSAVPRGSIL